VHPGRILHGTRTVRELLGHVGTKYDSTHARQDEREHERGESKRNQIQIRTVDARLRTPGGGMSPGLRPVLLVGITAVLLQGMPEVSVAESALVTLWSSGASAYSQSRKKTLR